MSRIFCCLIKRPSFMDHMLMCFGAQRKRPTQLSSLCFLHFFTASVLYSKDIMVGKWNAQVISQDHRKNLSWDNLPVFFQLKFILPGWYKMTFQIIQNTQKGPGKNPKSTLEKPNFITNKPQRIPHNKIAKQISNSQPQIQ